jgi:hypothetical protein
MGRPELSEIDGQVVYAGEYQGGLQKGGGQYHNQYNIAYQP